MAMYCNSLRFAELFLWFGPFAGSHEMRSDGGIILCLWPKGLKKYTYST